MTHEPTEMPPIVCTLSAEDLKDRSGEWADLLTLVIERRSTTDGVRLRLPNSPEAAATAADLIVREVQCCAFFTFVLTVDAGAMWLEVTAPPDGRRVVEALFA